MADEEEEFVFDIETNWEYGDIEFQISCGQFTADVIYMEPAQALFLAQTLIEKSLNIMEHHKKNDK